jgi:hypothetical protein
VTTRRGPVVAGDKLQEAAPQPAPGQAPRRGLTWAKVAHDSSLGIDRVHCYGSPALPKDQGGPGCNPYEGDTHCSQALPVLCLKEEGSSRPPYAMTCSAHAMPGEFYCGWAGGRIELTSPVVGFELASSTTADALCVASFGPGWRMAEHHDGKYVMGMGERAHHGDTWPAKALATGGWGLFAYGKIAGGSRFWVRINDQPGNCWDQ